MRGSNTNLLGMLIRSQAKTRGQGTSYGLIRACDSSSMPVMNHPNIHLTQYKLRFFIASSLVEYRTSESVPITQLHGMDN